MEKEIKTKEVFLCKYCDYAVENYHGDIIDCKYYEDDRNEICEEIKNTLIDINPTYKDAKFFN